MIVLSLFDGMSCGQIALNRAGIKYKKYYASEIDKYAIQVTQKNYPETIQLGDITKWKEWNIEQPDLIIGGSPCQGFSFAGKQLNFEDSRSKLFFVFIDILKHYKPKYFLLENVIMRQEHNDVISSILGEVYPEDVKQPELFRTGRLEPIEINSALVSAQNRKRLYWTNIKGIKQPKNKGILLKDIIEDAETDREKSYCIDANYYKGSSKENSDLKHKRQLVKIKDNLYKSRKERIYTKASPTLRLNCGRLLVSNNDCHWRKLTPLECERLQTVPDNYTESVSNTQRYKMLGNGWTVDVISHILGYIK